MEIKNKLQSVKIINELKLNKLPEQVFYQNETSKIMVFLKKYPAEYYAIRDKSKPTGCFKLKVKYEDVIKEITEYDLFSINVSSYNYTDIQVLVGEIEFLSTNEIYATLSTNPTYSVRDASKNPTFNIKTDILDKKLNNIPYFDYLYDYVIKNNLKDIIIEFSLFKKEIGINNENIVIYELRTDY